MTGRKFTLSGKAFFRTAKFKASFAIAAPYCSVRQRFPWWYLDHVVLSAVSEAGDHKCSACPLVFYALKFLQSPWIIYSSFALWKEECSKSFVLSLSEINVLKRFNDVLMHWSTTWRSPRLSLLLKDQIIITSTCQYHLLEIHVLFFL